MTTKAYDRTLAAWAKAWRDEQLTEETRILIGEANSDLYNGPPYFDDGTDYPGFGTACRRITNALDGMPRELFIDCDTETWTTEEPEPTECGTCDGEGTIPKYLVLCDDCKGAGCFGAYEFGEWYKVEYEDLVTAIVGRELAGYVR
jgi:hypothetical protein